jgi:SpoIVB peptidase S55
MSRVVRRRRGAALVALTASLGLVAGVPALSGGAAQSAEPTPDCAPAFPIANLVAGEPVDGLTVSKGTTPEPFTGEVIGVLHDGIAPGLDMVVMELDSPEIDRVGGIWAGMSGSPVYAENGDLIGAVAYGLAWGASPVAGITPFEKMDDYLTETAGRPGTIKVGKGLADKIARSSDVTARQASQGFTQLPMALGVSGLTAKRLAQGQDAERDYLGQHDTYVVGRAGGAAGPDQSTIVAGGNLAAALAYGDIMAAGVGTATSVCDGRVVGFGHPMFFAGDTTLSLHPADALYVQEDALGVPFKVANLGDAAGTITDDRRTGITGVFGERPQRTTITSTVTMGERDREGSTYVNIPAASAEMTFLEHLANHDSVVDGYIGGSAAQSYTITGSGADGSDFEISFEDRYQSSSDITFDSAFDVADLVWGLTSIAGVTVDSVTMDSVVSADKSAYTITGVQQRKNGAWVKVTGKKPATVKAGHTLQLRAVLSGPGGTRHVGYRFDVPKRFHDKKGYVYVTGGNWLWSDAPYQPTVGKIAKAVKAQVRNDETQAQFSISSNRSERVKTVVSGAVDKVVNGDRRVKVLVK